MLEKKWEVEKSRHFVFIIGEFGRNVAVSFTPLLMSLVGL